MAQALAVGAFNPQSEMSEMNFDNLERGFTISHGGFVRFGGN